MSDVIYESKADVIEEVLPICELLKEHHEKLAAMPRSTTATRQLAVIINRLEGWHQAFTLTPAAPPAKAELMKEIEALIDQKLR